MTCRVSDAGNGRVAIVCTRRDYRPIRCQFCGRKGSLLCDAKVGPKKTCDAKLCNACARKSGGSDFCPRHTQEGLL